MNNFTFNHQNDKPDSNPPQDNILIQDSIQIQEVTENIITPITDQLTNLQSNISLILKENKQYTH